MVIQPDIDGKAVLPFPATHFLVNLLESKKLIHELLAKLPKMHQDNRDPGGAFGAALECGFEVIVYLFSFFPFSLSVSTLKNRAKLAVKS